MDSLESIVSLVNSFLRYHTEYKIMIDLCSIYGLISYQIFKENKPLFSGMGATLEGRLEEITKQLQIEEWAKGRYKNG
jgi:hypothetical protein